LGCSSSGGGTLQWRNASPEGVPRYFSSNEDKTRAAGFSDSMEFLEVLVGAEAMQRMMIEAIGVAKKSG
jgi:hypothetical protein